MLPSKLSFVVVVGRLPLKLDKLLLSSPPDEESSPLLWLFIHIVRGWSGRMYICIISSELLVDEGLFMFFFPNAFMVGDFIPTITNSFFASLDNFLILPNNFSSLEETRRFESREMAWQLELFRKGFIVVEKRNRIFFSRTQNYVNRLFVCLISNTVLHEIMRVIWIVKWKFTNPPFETDEDGSFDTLALDHTKAEMQKNAKRILIVGTTVHKNWTVSNVTSQIHITVL